MWDAPHYYGAGGRHLSAGPAQRTTPVGLGSWARVAGSLELIDQCESDGAGTRRPGPVPARRWLVSTGRYRRHGHAGVCVCVFASGGKLKSIVSREIEQMSRGAATMLPACRAWFVSRDRCMHA